MQKKIMYFGILIVLSMIICISSAFSSTFYLPGNDATIQEGTDVVAGGDTILAADGTYHGNFAQTSTSLLSKTMTATTVSTTHSSSDTEQSSLSSGIPVEFSTAGFEQRLRTSNSSSLKLISLVENHTYALTDTVNWYGHPGEVILIDEEAVFHTKAISFHVGSLKSVIDERTTAMYHLFLQNPVLLYAEKEDQATVVDTLLNDSQFKQLSKLFIRNLDLTEDKKYLIAELGSKAFKLIDTKNIEIAANKLQANIAAVTRQTRSMPQQVDDQNRFDIFNSTFGSELYFKVKQLSETYYFDFYSDSALWYAVASYDNYKDKDWVVSLLDPNLVTPKEGLIDPDSIANSLLRDESGIMTRMPIANLEKNLMTVGGTQDFVLYRNKPGVMLDAPFVMNTLSAAEAIINMASGVKLSGKVFDYLKKTKNIALKIDEYISQYEPFFMAAGFMFETSKLISALMGMDITTVDQRWGQVETLINKFKELGGSIVTPEESEQAEAIEAIRNASDTLRLYKDILLFLYDSIKLSTTTKSESEKKSLYAKLKVDIKYFMYYQYAKTILEHIDAQELPSDVSSRTQLARNVALYYLLGIDRAKQELSAGVLADVNTFQRLQCSLILSSPTYNTALIAEKVMSVPSVLSLKTLTKTFSGISYGLNLSQSMTTESFLAVMGNIAAKAAADAGLVAQEYVVSLLKNVAIAATPAGYYKLAKGANSLAPMLWNVITDPVAVNFSMKRESENSFTAWKDVPAAFDPIQYIEFKDSNGTDTSSFLLDADSVRKAGVQYAVDSDGATNFLVMRGGTFDVENMVAVTDYNLAESYFEDHEQDEVIFSDWHVYQYPGMDFELVNRHYDRTESTAYLNPQTNVLNYFLFSDIGENFDCIDNLLCDNDTEDYSSGDGKPLVDDYLANTGQSDIEYFNFTQMFENAGHQGVVTHNTPGIYTDSTNFWLGEDQYNPSIEYMAKFNVFVATDYDAKKDGVLSHREQLLQDSSLEYTIEENQITALNLKLKLKRDDNWNYYPNWNQFENGRKFYMVLRINRSGGAVFESEPYAIELGRTQEEVVNLLDVSPKLVEWLEENNYSSLVDIPLDIFIIDSVVKSYFDSSNTNATLYSFIVNNNSRKEGTELARPFISINIDELTKIYTQKVTLDDPEDSDADGIPDDWELKYFDSITDCDPSADDDNDGVNNYNEYINNSNPLLAQEEPEPYNPPENTITYKPINVYDQDNNYLYTITEFWIDGTINSNIIIESGVTVRVQGYSTITGNLIHTGGDLHVNGGNLIVKGDYRIQTPDSNSESGYSCSYGFLNMTNTADRVLVEGSFVTDSYYGHSSYLTAGSLEVKGDFTQLNTYNYNSNQDRNFQASGTHRVLLSGTGQQVVSFASPHGDYSRFNKLEITNSSASGVDLASDVVVSGELVSTSNKISNVERLRLSGEAVVSGGNWLYDLSVGDNWVLQQNLVIEGNLHCNGSLDLNSRSLTVEGDIIQYGQLNLNGGSLLVKGNLIHTGGVLYVNGGNLIVKGDYRIQTPDSNSESGYSYSYGLLNMTNTADRILVEGNFVTESAVNHYDSLTAGLLEVRGNFTQLLAYYGYSNNPYNFHASGTHRVLLSGTIQQVVSFYEYNRYQDSCFNELEITNSSEAGVDLASYVVVVSELVSTSSKISNVEKLSLSGEAVVSGGNWLYDLSVGDNWVLQQNLVIEGNLHCNGSLDLNSRSLTVEGDIIQYGQLNLNGGSLLVKGNLIHTGGVLYVNGGNLIVKGDYRIQTPDSNSESGYSYSYGLLNMTNTADRILVEGNFVTESAVNHYDSLTAGLLEVRGNFTQLLAYYGYSNNPYNFHASGTHRVLLSGTGQQVVSFYSSYQEYSRFNKLEITNSSASGVDFASDVFVVSELVATASKVTNSNRLQLYDKAIISGGSWLYDLTVGYWTLQQNQLVKGNLYLNNSILDLNGKTLTIEGNLIHTGGDLHVNGGNLIVKGDYRIQTPDSNSESGYTYSSGFLLMTNAADRILVEGSFVTDSIYDHLDCLTAGLLEVRGNFTQLYSCNGCNGCGNFRASGTHRVLLSGAGQQVVSFASPGSSYFNELRITNPQGAVFETNAVIYASCPDKIITSYTDYLDCINGSSTPIINNTIYEDAEDGSTTGWSIYANVPAGASIQNVYDAARQSNVISFVSPNGTSNGYRLRNADGSLWKNTTQFVLQWSMKYSQNYTIYIDVQTSLGHRYLVYDYAASDALGSGEYVKFGLGVGSKDGKWHTYARDLEADLKRAQPANSIIQVNGFLIRGSGMVDDIKLMDEMPADAAQTIYETAEDGTTTGLSIYANVPAGASIQNVYDAERESNVISFVSPNGTSNGYRLRNADGSVWNNTTQFVLQWSMKYSQNYTIYIDVQTSLGHRYLVYDYAASDALGSGEYVKFGLGAESKDGKWHTYIRDLEADLKRAQPANSIVKVNGFLIRGSGMVDDIKLMKDFPGTIYENAEDGTTAGWSIYANVPAGASIQNVYEAARQSNVISFVSPNGTSNGYRLRNADGSLWNNTTQFILQWSMKYSQNYTIYIDVQTSLGHRYLVYDYAASDALGSGEYVKFGFGAGSKDGKWHTYARDLEADLKRAQPSNSIVKVNGFLIRGSGMVDDIKLIDSNSVKADRKALSKADIERILSQPYSDPVEIPEDEIIVEQEDYSDDEGPAEVVVPDEYLYEPDYDGCPVELPEAADSEAGNHDLILDVGINQSVYHKNDRLRLDVEMQGDQFIDLYLAIFFPDGSFTTITDNLNFSKLYAVEPYKTEVLLSSEESLSVMDMAVTESMPLGEYIFYGIAVPTGSDVLKVENWLKYDFEGFVVE